MAKKKDLTPEEKLQQAIVPKEEQPYPLPDGWRWVRLGSVVDLYNGDRGKSYPSKKDYVPEGIPFINAGAIQDNYLCEDYFNYITIKKYEELRAGKIQKNDILYCLRGSLGKCAIVDRDMIGAISSSLCIFRAKAGLNVNYLFYLLQSDVIKRQQEEIENGSAQPNLSAADVKKYYMPLPSMQEQERLVNYIEKWFIKINWVNNFLQKGLVESEKRRAVILYKAFTGELTTKWREEKNLTLDSWRHLTLNDIAEYKKGPFGSSIKKSMFVPKGKNTYKVYEQGNAIRKTINYGNYYITHEKFLELQSNEVKAGDIIISCSGTIGEVYKLPENCEKGIINQALMRVRLFNNVIERFFILYFSEILKSSVEIQANGTAIKNIPPFKIMKAMPVILPTISEQQEIIVILDNLLEKEQRLVDMAKQNLSQISLMKRSILENAFRGMLNVKNENEESFEC